jgi:hypothetical protein
MRLNSHFPPAPTKCHPNCRLQDQISTNATKICWLDKSVIVRRRCARKGGVAKHVRKGNVRNQRHDFITQRCLSSNLDVDTDRYSPSIICAGILPGTIVNFGSRIFRSRRKFWYVCRNKIKFCQLVRCNEKWIDSCATPTSKNWICWFGKELDMPIAQHVQELGVKCS